MFASLRVRLVAALLTLLLVGAAAAAELSALQAQSADELLEETSLAVQAHELLRGVSFKPSGVLASVTPGSGWAEAYRDDEGAFYTLYGADGRVEAASPNAPRPLPRLDPGGGDQGGPLALTGPDQVLTQAFRAPGGRLLVVARSNAGAGRNHADDRFAQLLPLLVVTGLLLCAVVVAAAVAEWSLRPLRRAVADAANIGPARPQARLRSASMPAEVRPLAEAINRALDRVAAAYEAEKRFTVEAAHALRTPLTVLDLRLQQVEDGAFLDAPRLRSDLDAVIQLVNGLLRLARSEAPATPSGPINLARVAREAAAEIAPLFERAGRSLNISAPEEAPVYGEVSAWREAVVALLDNALVHGEGEVALEVVAAPERTALRVSDQGAGIPASARDDVFRRFHKLDAASPGAGLGLAVVAALAHRAGGEAAWLDGALIEVRLPRR